MSNFGYSDMINNPEFVTGITKSVHKQMNFWRIVLSVPFFFFWGALIYTLRQNMFLPTKTIILYVILLFATFWRERQKVNHINEDSYEATVVMATELESTDSDGNTSTEKVIQIKKEDGKKKYIRNSGDYWDYAQPGDEVLIHPNYVYRIELKDKSKYEKLFCSSCGMGNDPAETHCQKCGCLLLK